MRHPPKRRDISKVEGATCMLPVGGHGSCVRWRGPALNIKHLGLQWGRRLDETRDSGSV
jgi:hypothetical protein